MSSLDVHELDVRGLIHRLPPFSDNVIRLMASLRQDYTKPDELEQRLIACPVIAGRVLSLANSSFYGFTRRIETLREACVILGQQTLKNLVYTLAVMDRFQRPATAVPDMEEPLPQRIWRYSLFNACGVATMVRYGQQEMPEAFTAALFEHLGLIFVEYFEQERFLMMFREADREGVTVAQVMLRHYACSPIELSHAALDEWQFPHSICNLLQSLAAGQSEPGTGLIRLSHLVSKCLGWELAPGIWPETPRAHDLEPCRFLLKDLPQIIDDWQRLFDQLASELL
jgi:HD-like signal output (HDOD) protein